MTSSEIVRVFSGLFSTGYNTRLCGGAPEPFYKAAVSDAVHHEIRFREDYVSSALHEIAHWCTAGRQRRQQDDYGYWYLGTRNARQQGEFEQLESKPQALEWIFSIAADVACSVSCDNFDEVAPDLQNLRELVRREAQGYVMRGLPERALIFTDALADYTGVLDYAEAIQFEGLPQ